jgi:hypothetical protein
MPVTETSSDCQQRDVGGMAFAIPLTKIADKVSVSLYQRIPRKTAWPSLPIEANSSASLFLPDETRFDSNSAFLDNACYQTPHTVFYTRL